MTWSDEADQAARASMKEAADAETRAKVEKDKREAEARGEIDVKKVLRDVLGFDADLGPTDAVTEILADLENEDED